MGVCCVRVGRDGVQKFILFRRVFSTIENRTEVWYVHTPTCEENALTDYCVENTTFCQPQFRVNVKVYSKSLTVKTKNRFSLFQSGKFTSAIKFMLFVECVVRLQYIRVRRVEQSNHHIFIEKTRGCYTYVIFSPFVSFSPSRKLNESFRCNASEKTVFIVLICRDR